MNPKQIPNILTVIRIGLIPPVVWFLFQESYQVAAILVAIAVFTDGLDGFLAKTFNWRTRFGEITDPIADKSLFIAVFVSLAVLGLIPWWLFLTVVMRDIIIVSGGLAYHYLIGPYDMSPSLISKLNTMVQFLFVFFVLMHLAIGLPGDAGVKLLTFLVMATTIISGLDYVITWGHRAWVQYGSKHDAG